MKVFQINCTYNRGSTGKIVYDIERSLLASGHSCAVCYGRGERCSEPHAYKTSSEFESKCHACLTRLFSNDLGHSPISTARILRHIEAEQPDIVHLHCLNSHFVNVYRLVEYVRDKSYKTVLTLHGEFMHTGGCGHAFECEKWREECHDCARMRGLISRFYRDDARSNFRRMKRAFSGFDSQNIQVVAVSDWLRLRAQASPILSGLPLETIHNGVDAHAFRRVDAAAVRAKYELDPERKTILHVTPSFTNPIKGGKYVVECAKKLPQYQFVIVGFNGDKSVLPLNITTIPFTQGKEELAALYSCADCTIMTSRRETFSLVSCEALLCGSPVVAFQAGGVEEVIPPTMGECVADFSVELMTRAIEKWANTHVDYSLYAQLREKFSKETMVARYLQTYQRLLAQ
ncbi:MAG: glycosyltransferase [Planctomycetia bacterium]|nr:glycosyltransferase [Planctomycetia bacterium]